MPALFLLYLASLIWIGGGITILLLIGLAVVCLIIGFRYMSSAWRKDTLLITTDNIILTEQKGFDKKQRSFSRSGISELRFLEKPELSAHPLAGKTFDYLGFQVQDRVINEMFGDHRVAFQYEGQTISFGRKLFSWDHAALQQALFGAAVEVEEELPWDAKPSFDAYWDAYQAFAASIPFDKKYIREQLDNTKLYVSELAEGWDEHRDALMELGVRYADQLTSLQQEKLEELIDFVEEVVRGDGF